MTAKKLAPAKLEPPPKVPHPLDDLIQAEPKTDTKLQQLDPRKLAGCGALHG